MDRTGKGDVSIRVHRRDTNALTRDEEKRIVRPYSEAFEEPEAFQEGPPRTAAR